MPITFSNCQSLDQCDALAPLREQFVLPEGVIYLDGNSLGALPKAAVAKAQEVTTKEWGQGLIRSWNTSGWFELPQRLGNKLAKLVGAQAGEVVVTDTTSINLLRFWLLHCVSNKAERRTRDSLCQSAAIFRPICTLPKV